MLGKIAKHGWHYSHRRMTLVRLGALFLISCLAVYRPCYADAVDEYTVKSVLALNLARYSEWPPEIFKSDSSTINLCILGSEIVQQAFALINSKSIGNKTLSVRNINDSKQLENCQLLFTGADAVIAPQLYAESYRQHTLTIGEAEDFLKKGGMIYMEMTDAKINLHVNLSAVQKAEVQISSRVLKLATIFKP